MKNILKGSFQLLHDSPAHVADYSNVIELDVFPLYFCATRWVEDKKVADRLLELWENLQKLWTSDSPYQSQIDQVAKVTNM